VDTSNVQLELIEVLKHPVLKYKLTQDDVVSNCSFG